VVCEKLPTQLRLRTAIRSGGTTCKMFPRFKQPRCREDYTTLIDDMRARRREASAIKWKFPHVLPVLNDCKDPVPWEGSTDISQPPQVPRRHQPKQRQRVFPEVSSPRDMQVLLLTPLQTGYTKWSQVYVALLTIGGRSCEVVIKLYQQCMFLEPNSANVDEWSSATEVAQREAWAYQMLERYQGSTIPYSYGFYMVNGIQFIPHFIGSCRCTVPAPN
jgi:hypothetical protein